MNNETNKAAEEGGLPEDVKAWIKGAVAIVKQDYRPECLRMASTKEYVQDAVHQLIEAGYRPTNKFYEDLPFLPKALAKFGVHSSIREIFVYTADQMRDYANAAIAADRASRQVANKAEVDLSSLSRFGYFATENGTAMVPKDGGKWVKFDDVKALLATPPATTGASTAKSIDTPEFCDLITELHAAHEEVSPANSKKAWAALVEHIDGFVAREVAAQAGQVAVPEDVADAKRYRWLRDSCYDTDPAGEGDAWDHPSLHFESSELEPYNSASLDAAIDADMQTAPSPAKESK